jgi:alpha-L-fucosidase
VFEGTTIGRKKITCFDATEASSIRIQFTHAKAAPVIRSIAAYYIQPFE